ncbi:hypothetical protein ACH5RR_029732 [Cinchona calisaya]|uniref:Uncharacterized protein n=1 Tax=Cinchona calisaya TaxID=153742 RepID=A0ABD2YTY4_9GENT
MVVDNSILEPKTIATSPNSGGEVLAANFNRSSVSGSQPSATSDSPLVLVWQSAVPEVKTMVSKKVPLVRKISPNWGNIKAMEKLRLVDVDYSKPAQLHEFLVDDHRGKF